MNERTWFIMDGRARYNMDQATVLMTVDDLIDGLMNLDDFGDAVIVSYGSENDHLVDGQIEYDPQVIEAVPA